MKPSLFKNLTPACSLLLIAASQSTAIAVPTNLYDGFYLDSGWTSGMTSTPVGTLHNITLYNHNGAVILTALAETAPKQKDGGVILWGKPVSLVLGAGTGGGTFDVWSADAYNNASITVPAFRIDTTATPKTAAFNSLNVSINSGSLTVAGDINLTGGAGTGISAGGNPIFSLDSAGKVTYASTRPVVIASTTASTSSITGALTVSGGIGVQGDINGIKVGRGNGNLESNLAIGINTLSITTGDFNIALGANALRNNVGGWGNTAVGGNALYSNTEGIWNSAYGAGALKSNTTGSLNMALGSSALNLNQTGSQNVAVGNGALVSNTTASWNTAVGQGALYSNTTGEANAALGLGSLSYNIAGSFNAAVGYQSLGRNNGVFNVAMGTNAGTFCTAGAGFVTGSSYSVYIGAYAKGATATDQRAIVIGHDAVGEGSNTTVIGSSFTTKTHLYGETNLNSLKVAGASTLTGAVTMSGPVTITVPQGDIPMFTGY